MQDTNFDRLLHRYLHNELTPEENAKFIALLDKVEKQNDRDLVMTADAKEALFQKISNSESTVEDVLALYPRKPLIKQLFSNRWIQVAATVLIMLSATFAVQYFINDNNSGSRFANQEKMILNDGTIVWINKSGNFTYYEKEGARFASFSGEALFEVAKNPNSPFIISCGNINVKVLGTSFTLKADSNKIELNVLTGKVNVTSNYDSIGVDVTPNERIVYSTAGIIERSSITSDVQTSIANSEYNMKFQGATMDKVIESISKKFDVTIVVVNQNLNKCHVSADFTDHSLEGTLSILTDLLDVSYRIAGKQVQLSGKGC
ncbi:MAG: FecR family protein [Cyclobacteriaceae bacterium]|nr:FecR family protein [Cyclobacteriaceae bacterium]